MSIMIIVCMYCNKHIGYKDGLGKVGETSTICRQCWAEHFPNIKYPVDKGERRVNIMLKDNSESKPMPSNNGHTRSLVDFIPASDLPVYCHTCGWIGLFTELIVVSRANPADPTDIIPECGCPRCGSDSIEEKEVK